MPLTTRDWELIHASRLCGWLAYRPGKSRRVELWEKWWPSGMMNSVRLQNCSNAILISRDFAAGENSARSRQFAASLMERRLDVSAVRVAHESFAADFVTNLYVPIGAMRWVITKEDLILWWALKRDVAEGID